MSECKTCKFFLPGDMDTGLCRRYPPSMTLANVKMRTDGGETTFESNWQFPPMMDFGYCGEHKSKARAK